MPQPGGTLPGDATLNQAPPNPADVQGASTGVPMGALGSLVPGGGMVPPELMPPEILTGVIQSAGTVNQTFASWAQVAPQFAPDIARLQALLQQVLSKFQAAGGGPTSPNAPGPQFPGGGMDTQSATLASGGQ